MTNMSSQQWCQLALILYKIGPMQQSGLDEAAVHCTLPFSDEILSTKKFRVRGRQYAIVEPLQSPWDFKGYEQTYGHTDGSNKILEHKTH